MPLPEAGRGGAFSYLYYETHLWNMQAPMFRRVSRPFHNLPFAKHKNVLPRQQLASRKCSANKGYGKNRLLHGLGFCLATCWRRDSCSEYSVSKETRGYNSGRESPQRCKSGLRSATVVNQAAGTSVSSQEVCYFPDSSNPKKGFS